MGGQSTTSQTQQSSTNPWAAAMPEVQGLLSSLNGLIPNSGTTGAEQGAINQLTAQGQAGNPYASAIGNTATSLLNGGGATDQSGAVSDAFKQYQAQTNPLASNTNYNPYSTPGFADAINTATSDITNGVNGQFAAGGRSFSGANSQALGRGLTQGLAPTIAAQYNANVANQQGAAQNLYNAGNTTAGLQTGLTQTGLANQQAGIGAASNALSAQQWGPQQTIAAQELAKSIPASNLGLLAQIGIPLAGLGTNSTGSSNTTNQASGATQFQQIAGGLNSLINPLKFLGF